MGGPTQFEADSHDGRRRQASDVCGGVDHPSWPLLRARVWPIGWIFIPICQVWRFQPPKFPDSGVTRLRSSATCSRCSSSLLRRRVALVVRSCAWRRWRAPRRRSRTSTSSASSSRIWPSSGPCRLLMRLGGLYVSSMSCVAHLVWSLGPSRLLRLRLSADTLLWDSVPSSDHRRRAAFRPLPPCVARASVRESG